MSMPRRGERLSALDLVEGLQLGSAVATLHERGVLASLTRPRTAEDIARRLRLDPVVLRGTLAYAAARTGLVSQTGRRFVATPAYSAQARFLLGLYGVAHGGRAVRRGMNSRTPKRSARSSNDAQYARAFAAAGRRTSSLSSIVRQLGMNHVLDLGCGPADMLVDLARRNRHFIGWGLERNPAMCGAARRAVRSQGVAKRIRILEGDATRLTTSLPRGIAARVRAVTASQLANEFFGAGSLRVVRWLRHLRRILPGRPLLLADYYGRLGTADGPREVLLHDYVQLVSGQGIPLPDLAGWTAVYAAAGCRLAHVLEDRRTTLFVHVVVL